MYAFPVTIGAFALILVLARLRVPLAAAILAGAVALGLLMGAAGELPWLMLTGAIRPATLALVAVQILLLVLSRTMQLAGQLERIVTLARAFFRRPAVAMAALPALIGLLPMPGGALFSAPMVRSAAGEVKVSGAFLSAVNYWYRHIWEHWWPLYPGVILAMTLTDRSFGAFVAFQMPLGVFMAVAGLLIFRGSHSDLHATAPPAPAGTKRRLLRETSSITVILAVWALATSAVEALDVSALGEQGRMVLEKYLPVTLGLAVSLAWTVRLNRVGGRTLLRAFADRSIYDLGLLVLTVMVFQHVLESVNATPRIASELAAIHLPVEAVVATLPFVAGMVTGLAVGFVGTSFPIVLGLVAALPGQPALPPPLGAPAAYVALAYAFGHLGQMISPIHLCYVVSNRYFETPFAPVYRSILGSAIVTAVLAVAYFAILRLVFGS